MEQIASRKCYSCQLTLELNNSNFSLDKNSPAGLNYQCKACKSKETHKHRRAFIKQKDFMCEICGLQKLEEYQFFDVDHIKPIRRVVNSIKSNDKMYIDHSNLQLLCPNCHRIKTIKEGRG